MKIFIFSLIFISSLLGKDAQINYIKEDIYATFSAQGVKESMLKINSNGIVDKIFVDVGSQVKKGDLLLSLKNGIQKEQVKIQEATLEAQTQAYLFKKNQFDRYEKSRETLDQNTFEQIYFDFKGTESSLNVVKSTLNLHKEMLSDTYLYAPYDGVIAEKYIELGEGVTQNNTPIFKIISKEIKLILEFDSKHAGKVKVGNIYTFSVDGGAKKYKGKISKVYPNINVRNRKMQAEVMVNNIISGVFGDGFIGEK